MEKYIKTLSVLYADDSETARRNYTEYLAGVFRHVYEASDGKTAWELYIKHRPDIILLDIEMPQLSGLELAKKIREKDKRTRIIIATAYGNKPRLIEAVELGLTRFLPKPFGRKSLKEALDKAVSELFETNRIDLGEGFFWDLGQNRLINGIEPVKLTPSERKLLGLLASKPGQVFSFIDIELELWPMEINASDGGDRLKTLIKRLRKKLPDSCIENIYGEGYRINHSVGAIK